MYTISVALHINNPQVEQKVKDLAAITGESMTDAIAAAVEQRILQMRPSATSADPTLEEVLELVRSFKLQSINDGLSEDEILGYGPHGFSE